MSIIFVEMKVIIFLGLLWGSVMCNAEAYYVFEKNGKKGLKNERGDVIIPPNFEELGWSDGNFSVVKGVTGYRLHQQWGLINLENKIVLVATFQQLYYAGNDCVIARKNELHTTPKMACLSVKGEIKIPFVYENIQIIGSNAIVYKWVGSKARYGLCDLQNHLRLPLNYKYIDAVDLRRFAVQNDQGKWTLCNEEGASIAQLDIDSISPYHKGYAVIFKNELQGLIDYEGTVKLEPKYQSIKFTNQGKISTLLPNQWCWINDTNTPKGCYTFDTILPLNNDYYAVSLNGKWGVADSQLNIVIPIQYTQIRPTQLSQFSIQKKNKEGLIDITNTILVNPQYDSLCFSQGFYKVFIKHEGWQLLDGKGKLISTKQYERIGTKNEWGFYVIKNGLSGIINEKGKEVIPCIYDSIIEIKGTLAVLKFKGKYGIMDTHENWKLVPQPHTVSLINENYYLLRYPSSFFLKSFQGELVYFTRHRTKFKEEYWIEIFPNGNERYITYQGTIIKTILPKSEPIQHIFAGREGFRAVKKDNKFGFIDDDGKLRIANRYDSVGNFYEGLAPVKLIGKWGFVDTSDRIVVQPNYQSASMLVNGIAIVKQKNKIGLIDKKGKIILPPHYTSIERQEDGTFILTKDGLKGYADKKGIIQLDTRFDQLQELKNGFLKVSRGGKWGVVTSTGRDVIPILYDQIFYSQSKNEYLTFRKSEWKVNF